MSVVVGLLACGASSICFGSMFVAIRKAGDPGDGMVVQWLVCSAIFMSGLVTHIATGFPPFQPFAMLGGAIWTIGNLTALPIIDAIGLGMGNLIWGVVNCVMGWATGRFGLFGLKNHVPNSPLVNYAGLLIVIVGGVLFAFVRPKNAQLNAGNASSNSERLAEERVGLVQEEEDGQQDDEDREPVVQIVQQSDIRKRAIAILLSIFAGACYASTFTPVIYMQDNPEKFHSPPREAILYVHSHFSGLYLVSSVILVIYAAYKQNRPQLDNALILPSMLAGILWALGMLCMFFANDLLSEAITFPITTMSVGIVAAMWSVFYFKEVDSRDFKLLSAATAVTALGVTLVGLSKTM